MSEPVAKMRPDVDFDEFERRLRQSEGSQFDGRKDDPLAELARLVGQHHDPYGDVFGEDALARRAADYAAYERAGLLQPAFEENANVSPRLSGDFAAIEAGLRSGDASHAAALGHRQSEFYPDHDPQHHDPHYQHDPAYLEEQGYLQDHEAQQWAAEAPPAAEPTPRSRRPIFAMVATIAVGVIGVGAAFAYKSSSSSPSEIKTIAAASGPSKIQPPVEAKADQPGQDSAMLGTGQPPAPTQLVSREEQPVDISQAVQENASRNPDAGAAPGDASNVPVPPSPTQARDGQARDGQGNAEAVSPSDQIASFGMSGMPAPKKVKVVSVRPDGTILPNDAPPAGALPPSVRALAAKPADPAPTPVAKTSTPKASTPKTAKGATSAKTTSRVASTPKAAKVASDDTADSDAAPAPKPAKKAKPAKPQRVASADATDDAEPTASLPATKASGSFAVQLAAPGSEADAKSASSRLAKKFASALGGRKLGFRKADSNGKSVYRVRVGSLSKEEATSICEKLKADGGSCFVAKN